MEVQEISHLPWNEVNQLYWSVMIPTYNPHPDHFERALRSVLTQDLGPERMQIEVVDDCSPDVDVAALVKSIAGDQIGYSRNEHNLGLARSWNRCIDRSTGVWVHILHQDDYVAPEFYERMEEAANSHPDVGLVVARCFLMDEHGLIKGVTDRLTSLESGGTGIEDYFYTNPFRCPGVVVRRGFYESHGGFRTDLTFTLDWEMWLRAISLKGGLALPDVLAYYRSSQNNASTRLATDADTLHDRSRLSELLAERYPTFDRKKANEAICIEAISEARRLAKLGNENAALANIKFYRRHASMKLKLRHFAGRILRKISK